MNMNIFRSVVVLLAVLISGFCSGAAFEESKELAMLPAVTPKVEMAADLVMIGGARSPLVLVSDDPMGDFARAFDPFAMAWNKEHRVDLRLWHRVLAQIYRMEGCVCDPDGGRI